MFKDSMYPIAPQKRELSCSFKTNPRHHCSASNTPLQPLTPHPKESPLSVFVMHALQGNGTPNPMPPRKEKTKKKVSAQLFEGVLLWVGPAPAPLRLCSGQCPPPHVSLGQVPPLPHTSPPATSPPPTNTTKRPNLALDAPWIPLKCSYRFSSRERSCTRTLALVSGPPSPPAGASSPDGAKPPPAAPFMLVRVAPSAPPASNGSEQHQHRALGEVLQLAAEKLHFHATEGACCVPAGLCTKPSACLQTIMQESCRKVLRRQRRGTSHSAVPESHHQRSAGRTAVSLFKPMGAANPPSALTAALPRCLSTAVQPEPLLQCRCQRSAAHRLRQQQVRSRGGGCASRRCPS